MNVVVVERANLFFAQHPHRESQSVRISSPDMREDGLERVRIVYADEEHELESQPSCDRDKRD